MYVRTLRHCWLCPPYVQDKLSDFSDQSVDGAANLQRADQYTRTCLVLMDYCIPRDDGGRAQHAVSAEAQDMVLNLFQKCKLVQILVRDSQKASAKASCCCCRYCLSSWLIGPLLPTPCRAARTSGIVLPNSLTHSCSCCIFFASSTLLAANGQPRISADRAVSLPANALLRVCTFPEMVHQHCRHAKFSFSGTAGKKRRSGVLP